MRLISQRKLFFREGSSDKVYEADLCEAGEGEFIVNFRYGRRGTRLREGTKTPFPVGEAEAREIFDELVASKIKKGYSEANDDSGAEEEREDKDPPRSLPSPESDCPRLRKIQQHLETAAGGGVPKNWKLSRIIWRAGELGTSELAESLVKVPVEGSNEVYSLAWALGKTGNPTAVERLEELRQSEDEPVSRIATESLLACLPDTGKDALLEELRKELPGAVRDLLIKPETTAEEFTVFLEDRLENGRPPHDYLYMLYTQAEPYPIAREAIYHLLRTRRFKAPWFRAIRHIFKAAEFRLDSEIFGLIAWRFEKSDGDFTYNPWGFLHHYNEATRNHEQVELDKEYQRPDCRFGYSTTTREYFRRRICRTLKRFGELDDPRSFITLATGVLMEYDDETDKLPVRTQTDWRWDSRLRETVSTDRRFGPFARYLPLNYLLYDQSDRYHFVNRKDWVAKEDFIPIDETGITLPPKREEAFPHLWNAAPDAIEHLLRHSRCSVVHEFAAKVWQDNPSFNERINVDLIVALVEQAFPVSQQLGIGSASDIFDPAKPNRDLILAFLGCELGDARQMALNWLSQCRKLLVEDGAFLARVILIHHSDVQADLRGWIGVNRPERSVLDEIIPEVVGRLLTLDPATDVLASEKARNARETLVMISGDRLGDLAYEMVRELLRHPEPENQILGAQSLSFGSNPVKQIPDELWELMLTSANGSVREIGMGLFAKLDEEALRERAEILASFCLSELEDIRRAARPIVERLANQDPGFGQDMVLQFYPLVLRKEEIEGLHDDVYELLAGPLLNHLHAIPAESSFRMMESIHAAGQRLGFLILQKFIGLDQVDMRSIAKLGGQEHRDGRELIWTYYRDNLDRVKTELGDALRLLDTDWEDTREFGYDYFRNQLSEEDWSPETLVSLCDSPRGNLQDFGREMITRFFREENGQEYLLKLSQHPTGELQAFATNYLERFASGDLERIVELEPYFITVLSQVNRGRVAKQRVMKFLEAEAGKRFEIAEVVMPILARISGTIAIEDKAACIAAIHRLQDAWPELGSPLKRIEPPIYQPS